jgi:hypothetical protein
MVVVYLDRNKSYFILFYLLQVFLELNQQAVIYLYHIMYITCSFQPPDLEEIEWFHIMAPGPRGNRISYPPYPLPGTYT